MASMIARIRYQMLRSPLAPALKAGQRLRNRGTTRQRDAAAAALTVDGEAKRLAQQFNADGFVLLDALVDQGLLQNLAEAAHGKVASADSQIAQAPPNTSSKRFWDRLLDDDLVDGRLPAASPFARFAVQPRLIGFLAECMGTLPQLDYVLLTLSQPTGAPLAQSQLWHRDYDDTRTIKIFVYLTDVTDDRDGPFTFLPAPDSQRVGYTLHSHLPDEKVFRRVSSDRKRIVLAPAMSVFAVETSRCLHMGSRVAEGHRRLLYTATYTTFPKLDGSIPRGFHLSGMEDPLTMAVLHPGAKER